MIIEIMATQKFVTHLQPKRAGSRINTGFQLFLVFSGKVTYPERGKVLYPLTNHSPKFECGIFSIPRLLKHHSKSFPIYPQNILKILSKQGFGVLSTHSQPTLNPLSNPSPYFKKKTP
jgi:hypothetical protein